VNDGEARRLKVIVVVMVLLRGNREWLTGVEHGIVV